MVQGPIAMKPRQVLLSSSSAKVSSNGKPLTLTAEQRPLLLQAICAFLESNGFSKTLKKFLSEASLEKESWKNCLLNLEDACCVYLDARSQNDADENNIDSDKKTEKMVNDDENIKSKEKKKKKSGKDSSTQTTEVHAVEPEVALEDTPCQEKSSKKAKDKKKKKGSEPAAEPLSEELQPSCGEKGNKQSTEPEKALKSKSERKKNKASKVDDVEENGSVVNEGVGEGAEQSKKTSKKRKKSSFEENKSDDLGTATEDSKRRKTTNEGDEGTDEQLENGKVHMQTPSTAKHSEILPGDDDEDNSALKKSSAKKQNGSTEDGADIGYGAKAQEVLGQVRGRDFRHEKTKKKRGSYRGGLIDLQSHSVKFNYEDE
ncbi:hypothetical protein V2J09_021417 [Rumex salicifolius]